MLKLICTIGIMIVIPISAVAAQLGEVYELPVRVHVISSKIPPLHANISDEEIGSLLARVNEIWQVAGIVWQLESIERRDLANEERVIAGLKRQIPFSANELLSAVMSGAQEAMIWNVYLVSDLTGILGVPGIYAPGLQSLTSSQRDPAGINDPGRILAHELGHSLSLKHVQCVPKGNLMAPGCAGRKRTRLEPQQIQAARSQAAQGSPDSRLVLQ